MAEFYDVTRSLLLAKANEGTLAFAGFRGAGGAPIREGVLKVAAFIRANSSHGGYLTLTFVLDLESDPERREAFRLWFRRADQDALAARLGPEFEMALEMPLNAFASSDQFYIEEMNLYFRRLGGHERRLLEQRVIPALAGLLELNFDRMEWLAGTSGGIGRV